MKAKMINGVVSIFPVLPNRYKSENINCAGGFMNSSREVLEAEGFFDLIDEPFNPRTQTLSQPVFDEQNRVFRRTAIDIVINVEEFKADLIAQVKREAGNRLQPTDWQVTRFAETGTPVDTEVLAERQGIRSRCNIVEAEILALNAANEVLMYDISF